MRCQPSTEQQVTADFVCVCANDWMVCVLGHMGSGVCVCV